MGHWRYILNHLINFFCYKHSKKKNFPSNKFVSRVQASIKASICVFERFAFQFSNVFFTEMARPPTPPAIGRASADIFRAWARPAFQKARPPLDLKCSWIHHLRLFCLKIQSIRIRPGGGSVPLNIYPNITFLLFMAHWWAAIVNIHDFIHKATLDCNSWEGSFVSCWCFSETWSTLEHRKILVCYNRSKGNFWLPVFECSQPQLVVPRGLI